MSTTAETAQCALHIRKSALLNVGHRRGGAYVRDRGAAHRHRYRRAARAAETAGVLGKLRPGPLYRPPGEHWRMDPSGRPPPG
jgi:hypothetical protein